MRPPPRVRAISTDEKNGVFGESLAKERLIGRKQRETFRAAHKAGVKMIFGTDGGSIPTATMPSSSSPWSTGA